MSIPTGSRVATDLPDLNQYGAPLKTVFRDLQAEPDPSFLECMLPISNQIIPEAQEMAQRTHEQAHDGKRFGKFRHDPISEDHLAVIIKYCQEDTIPPLYKEANCACYKPDRQSVNPFKLFLWLLVRAMASLQPYLGSLVHRGVKRDLRSEYLIGREFTWQGFTSATKSLQTLTNDMFLGDCGPRTIFTIELTQRQARDISAYSPLDEGEVLLPPGSRFRVMGTLQQTDLTIVQLKELPSEEWILKLPQGITADMLEQQLRQTEQDLGVAVQKLTDEMMDKEKAQQNCRKEMALAQEHLRLFEAREQQLQHTSDDLNQELQQKQETLGKVLQELTDERMAKEKAHQECQELKEERALAAEQLASTKHDLGVALQKLTDERMEKEQAQQNCRELEKQRALAQEQLAREQQLQHTRHHLNQELQQKQETLGEELQQLTDERMAKEKAHQQCQDFEKERALAAEQLALTKDDLGVALQNLTDERMKEEKLQQNSGVIETLLQELSALEQQLQHVFAPGEPISHQLRNSNSPSSGNRQL